jgi:hypothetical protein
MCSLSQVSSFGLPAPNSTFPMVSPLLFQNSQIPEGEKLRKLVDRDCLPFDHQALDSTGWLFLKTSILKGFPVGNVSMRYLRDSPCVLMNSSSSQFVDAIAKNACFSS